MPKMRLQRMWHLDEDAVAALMDSSSWADVSSLYGFVLCLIDTLNRD